MSKILKKGLQSQMLKKEWKPNSKDFLVRPQLGKYPNLQPKPHIHCISFKIDAAKL